MKSRRRNENTIFDWNVQLVYSDCDLIKLENHVIEVYNET